MKSEDMDNELSELVDSLEGIRKSISLARKEKDNDKVSELLEQRIKLESKRRKIEHKKDEKQKLSTHTLHVSVEEFERRLFTLIKLVRSSIMYLSLAINLDTTVKKAN